MVNLIFTENDKRLHFHPFFLRFLEFCRWKSFIFLEYTLFGSQWRDQTGYRGGFGDRPGAHRDYYHTCYALSGLAAMSYVYDDSGNLVKHDIGQEQSVALLNSIHNVRPVAVLDIYDFFTTH